MVMPALLMLAADAVGAARASQAKTKTAFDGNGLSSIEFDGKERLISGNRQSGRRETISERGFSMISVIGLAEKWSQFSLCANRRPIIKT
jgi:hypothetical protein